MNEILPTNMPGVVYSPARASHRTRKKGGRNLIPFQSSPLINPSGPVPGMTRKIDAKYQWIHDLDMEEYVNATDLLPENKATLKQFLRDAALGKTIRHRAKKKVAKARLVKYVQDLKKLDKAFRKPFLAVTQADMERFILDLEEGRLRQSTGKPYAPETRVAIKKIIIKFYRWLNGGTTPDLVTWIDTSFVIRDYSAPKKDQIDRLLTGMTSNSPTELRRNRALISVLFDGGLRADELLNIRLEQVWRDKGVYWIRVQYSKTKPRTMNLPLSTPYLDEWLSVHPAKNDPTAYLFPFSYTALHHIIMRCGRAQGIRLKPHTLRHSSATYWARHLSRYQLCARMGWALSSRQPDRYIDQEGLGEPEKALEVVEQTSSARLTLENDELKRRLSSMEDLMAQLLERDRRDLKEIITQVRAEIEGGAR